MKTKFTKEMFTTSGVYLLLNDPEGRWNPGPFKAFLARFKHRGPITMAKFKKELINNWTVEDYLYELNVKMEAPFRILRQKNPDWYNKQIKQFKDKYVH